MVQARKKVDVLATAPSNHIFDRPTLTMWVVVAIVGQTVCLSTRQLVSKILSASVLNLVLKVFPTQNTYSKSMTNINIKVRLL